MLGEAAAALAVGRLDHARVEAAGPDELPWPLEAAHVARLRREIAASKLTTMAGQQHVAMTTAPEVFLSAVMDFLN